MAQVRPRGSDCHQVDSCLAISFQQYLFAAAVIVLEKIDARQIIPVAGGLASGMAACCNSLWVVEARNGEAGYLAAGLMQRARVRSHGLRRDGHVQPAAE